MKHIIESQQFTLDFLNQVYQLSDEMRENPSPYQLNGKILATLFFEPSTRTRLSFESAMHKLGGSVISTEKAQEFSSHSKGESLEDSIKVLSRYADVIALRHFEIGSAKRAAKVSSVPVINAGDGAGQHPSQSLLDLYTIKRNFGQIDDLTICMVGDLLYGRTVRSLCYLLGRFYKVKLLFVAPQICRMGADIKQFLDEQNVHWEEVEDFESALKQADCVYMTRIQKERFLDMGRYESACNLFKIDKQKLESLKKDAIVMHPLPRLEEIAVEVDDDPRMHFFEQAANGVWVRMSIISMLLHPELALGEKVGDLF